jgi:hypothetical protein
MYVKQFDKDTMIMAGTKERFNMLKRVHTFRKKNPYWMLKRVNLRYKVTDDDHGKTIAFKKGVLWWRRYIPIYITPMYIGHTGWEILHNKI